LKHLGAKFDAGAVLVKVLEGLPSLEMVVIPEIFENLYANVCIFEFF